jgi:hypothetical protein
VKDQARESEKSQVPDLTPFLLPYVDRAKQYFTEDEEACSREKFPFSQFAVCHPYEYRDLIQFVPEVGWRVVGVEPGTCKHDVLFD